LLKYVKYLVATYSSYAIALALLVLRKIKKEIENKYL